MRMVDGGDMQIHLVKGSYFRSMSCSVWAISIGAQSDDVPKWESNMLSYCTADSCCINSNVQLLSHHPFIPSSIDPSSQATECLQCQIPSLRDFLPDHTNFPNQHQHLGLGPQW